MIKNRALVFTFVFIGFLHAAVSAGAQEQGDDSDPEWTSASTFHIAPIVAANLVPGFGIGSLVQDDEIGFRVLLLTDLLTYGLIGGSLGVLYASGNIDEEEAGGVEVLTLLWGYLAFARGKTYGVIRPVSYGIENGVDTEKVFAPAVYNLFPGFGVGSANQGDDRGALVGAVADTTALALIGVLSFAALAGGGELGLNIATVAGLSAYGIFLGNKVYGVARPIWYKRNRPE
jgi:hypothetical protein